MKYLGGNMNRRSIWNLLLVFVLILGLVVSPLQGVALAAGEEKEITILHTNDVHGRDIYSEKDGAIGYSKYKTLINQKKAKGPTLVLDAGDAIHGTNFANLSKGEAPVKLMKEAGVRAMVPGNHEFNYGADRLIELNKQAGFDFLAANIEREDGSKPFKAYEVYEEGGVKIGVFGIATPETKYKSHPNNTKGLNFTDEVKAADEAVEALKAQGVDFIVGLAHLGVDESSDVTSYTLYDGMKNKADVDAIIDGHSHTTFENGKEYNGGFIASTGYYFKNIGELKLKKTADGKKSASASLIHFDEVKDVALDSDVDAIAKTYLDANDEILKEVIGNTTTELDGARPHVRAGETNLADLITDAILKATDADAVMTNGGGIRASIDKGEITMGEAFEVLPFGNLVTVIKVKGQAIVDALKHGAGDYPETKGAFPQVAGLEYTITVENKKTTVGDVKIAGKPIELDKDYTLATNDFMAVGGDGYTMFEGSEQVQLHGSMLEIFADYLKDLSKDGPFTYEADGRIKIVNKDLPKEVKGYAATDLNIRSEVGGEIIGVLPALSEVKGVRYPYEPNYIEIDHNGQKGFVYAPLVGDGLASGYASSDVNMRKSANGEISKVLDKGAYVEGVYFNSDPNWLLVKHNGNYSYVYKPLLQENPVAKSGYLISAMNLRKEPKVADNIIKVLPDSMKVTGTIDKNNPSWIKVSYFGQEGYVYAPRLAAGLSKGYTTSDLNYRELPNGKIIGKVKKGEAVKGYKFSEDSRWTMVRKDGKEGYIFNKYISSQPVK